MHGNPRPEGTGIRQGDFSGSRHRTKYLYSEIGGQTRPTEVQGAANQHLTILGDGPQRIQSITDQDGRSVQYRYDSDGNLQEVEDPVGGVWSYTSRKTTTHTLLEEVRYKGVLYASASYDSDDRAIAYMEGGRSWIIEYQDDRTVKRDASGNSWEAFHEGQGVLTEIKDPAGTSQQRGFQADYTPASEVEEDGSSWQYGDGGEGRISSVRRVSGTESWTSNVEHDATWTNEPKKIKGPPGWGGLAMDYDDYGNVQAVRRILQDGETEESLYTVNRNTFGEVLWTTDATGARTDFTYDTDGRLTRVQLPANNSSGIRPEYGFEYDALNRVVSTTDPMGRAVTREYDKLDRLVKVTLPNPGTGATGFVWRWTHDDVVDGKFKSTATDFNGAVTETYEDAWGHVLKMVDQARNERTAAWDEGRPVEIVDAEGNSTTYQYDDLGRLEKIRHPEGTFTEFTYTPDGKLSTRTDRKAQLTTFDYDGLGRIRSLQYPEGTIYYDYTGPVLTAVRDNAEGGGQKVTSYEYDTSLRLTKVTNDRGIVEYQWLTGDLLGGYRVDGGTWINYSYYPSGDLHAIQRQGDPSPFEYTYRIDGAREQLRYSNGSTVNYTWDNLGRLLTLTNLDPVSAIISRYSYAYDINHHDGSFAKKGLRVSMTEDLPAGSTGQEKYFFDALYQLDRVDYPDGDVDGWTYDRIGNRMSSSAIIPNEEPVVRAYSYYPNGAGGHSQRLQSDGVNTYTWDNNGNMATKTAPDGVHTYAWDSRDELTGIAGPTITAAYRYDFQDRRSSKTVNTVETIYHYNGLDLVKEISAGLVTEYMFGAAIDEILQMRASSTNYAYLTDGLGSVRQIVDPNGALANSYSFDTWGEIRQQTLSIASPFTFTARELSEDGLLFYRARYLSPSTGRFISVDPLGFLAGDTNFYRYVFDNPTQLVDPLGMDGGATLAIAIGLTLLGGATMLNAPSQTEPLYDSDPATGVLQSAVVGTAGGMALSRLGAWLLRRLGLRLPFLRPCPSPGSPANLRARVNAIHSALDDPIAMNHRTTAILEVRNPDGTISRIVSSSEVGLSPAQRAALQSGEMPAMGVGHAEETAINLANANGQLPLRIEVSRPVCPNCVRLIRSQGISTSTASGGVH